MIAFSTPDNYKSRGELIRDNEDMAVICGAVRFELKKLSAWGASLRAARWWFLVPERVKLFVRKIWRGWESHDVDLRFA